MIPRFKPYLGTEELFVALRRQEHAVEHFEEAFAHTFETRYAIAFRYARSGLWAFFKALGIEGAEVIMPAYTCVVVAHAIVLSGNVPRFVDVTLYAYNMELDQVAAAINGRTRAIIATHLFGYPLNVDRLAEIVHAAEARWGHRIWIIQDCAQAFGARWRGRLVCSAGDAAIFSLHISKLMTSMFGGMVTTSDPGLAKEVRAFRDEVFVQPDLLKRFRRFLYLPKVYLRYNEQVYGLVDWLKEETRLLDRLTKQYHLGTQIRFPPDYLDQMIELEARIGLAQLRKYPEIVRRQRDNARHYDQHLVDTPELTLPPLVEGATYSFYAVRVADRQALLQASRHQGVHLGQFSYYCVPSTPAYAQYTIAQEFPHAQLCGSSVVTLPVYAHLTERQRARVVELLLWTCSEGPK